MKVILSNFGDESIALIQWAKDQHIENVTVASFVTGFEAPQWNERITKGIQWVHDLGFKHQSIEPKLGFTELMQAQGKFPTRKFQWCANFLKGLPLLDWLDDTDPNANATILIARRINASRANFDLQAHIEEEEKLGDRTLWHPLIHHSNAERDALITKAGFPILNHRSLECDPCVNSDLNDVLRMDLSVIERTAELEKKLSARLLDEAIYDGTDNLLAAIDTHNKREIRAVTGITENHELFDMGCGNAFGCGL